VVEGEQLDAAVDGLGGDFGVAEAACGETRGSVSIRAVLGLGCWRGYRTRNDVGQ
jgi:hypothetical protein